MYSLGVNRYTRHSYPDNRSASCGAVRPARVLNKPEFYAASPYLCLINAVIGHL